MLLKNLMEEKQLNFDQPLLSVRRHSPTATPGRDSNRIDSYSHQLRPHLPTYRSELKSGPIRIPGAVPFLWEQSPGQPKEETKPVTSNAHKPPIAPRLPPGRAKQQDSSHDISMNTTGSNSQAVNLPCTSESKKPDLDASCEACTGPFNDENDTAEEKEGSDSEDSDEAYVDALDTLSRAESSFLNCSVNGLSGLEDYDVKPPGSFSSDPQAREFMMDRFLHAAKAMASETPHSPKKQPVQLKIHQPNKVANQCKPSLRYGPSFAQRYAYYQDNEEEEEEESDDECDQRASLPSVCGLLPRFCLKSSLSLLSPAPASSLRTRVPKVSANKIRPASSSAGSYSELENESRSDKSETKSSENFQKAELGDDYGKVRSDIGKLENHTLPILEQKEVILVPADNMQSKGLKTFQEFLDDRESAVEPRNSGDHVVEKTLYVDTLQKVESPNVTPGVPKLLDEHAVDSAHEDLKKLHAVDGDETSQEAMVGSETQLSVAVATRDNSKQKNYGLPAPPPLPKSPSDSWLWRTLPSMTAKHSSLRPYLGAARNPENHSFKAPTRDMKWETIVKTMHYSEESLTTIPET